MKKIPLILTLLACLSLGLLGLVTACKSAPKADPAKIEACKESAKGSSDACKKCCKEAGASGHMWTSSSGCKCL